MAKRFTATEKWDDPFFLDLPNKYKLFWIFMLDKCDHAGIFQVSQRAITFHLDADMTVEELRKTFASRIHIINEHKWFIPKFIEFQYGELKDTNNAHLSVIRLLKKQGLYKPLISSSRGAMDKEQDKDKDKYKKEVDEIIQYFNEKTDSSYRLTTESHRNNIRARLSDGFTVANARQVIDTKTSHWKGTEEEQYLTLETLFRPSKFEKYLNQKIKSPVQSPWEKDE